MSDAASNSRCPRCGAAFRCGMVGGDARCWCAVPSAEDGLPVPAPESNASCFCPACLAAVKAERAEKTRSA